jgi:hypothetical protein
VGKELRDKKPMIRGRWVGIDKKENKEGLTPLLEALYKNIWGFRPFLIIVGVAGKIKGQALSAKRVRVI